MGGGQLDASVILKAIELDELCGSVSRPDSVSRRLASFCRKFLMPENLPMCEQGFWHHFSGTRNWRQKLARIEHVLFQASFCRETPPLIGRSTGDHIFAKHVTS